MSDMRVLVTGLREFRTELRNVSRDLPKELQKENKAIAQEVAGKARTAYQSLYQQRSGRGAASIRGLANQTRAQVAIGSARAPYVLGQEFGANQRQAVAGFRGSYNYGPGARGSSARRSSMRQFPAYKPSPTGRGGEGYFTYPTIRRMVPAIRMRYGSAIDRVTAKAFPGGAR